MRCSTFLLTTPTNVLWNFQHCASLRPSLLFIGCNSDKMWKTLYLLLGMDDEVTPALWFCSFSALFSLYISDQIRNKPIVLLLSMCDRCCALWCCRTYVIHTHHPRLTWKRAVIRRVPLQLKLHKNRKEWRKSSFICVFKWALKANKQFLETFNPSSGYSLCFCPRSKKNEEVTTSVS